MEGPNKPGAPKGKEGSTGKSPGGSANEKGGGQTTLAKNGKGEKLGPDGAQRDIPGQGEKSGPNGAGLGKTKGDKAAKPGPEQTPEPGQPGRGQGTSTTPPPPGTATTENGKPPDVSKDTAAGLFKPQSTPPGGGNPAEQRGAADGGSNEGSTAGSSTKLGKSGKAPDLKDIDGIADPVEREAARKLQQAVERIKANRDRRLGPPGGSRGNAPPSDSRRDW